MGQPPFTTTASVYTFSVWLKGAVGGEQTYLLTTPNGVTYYSTLVTLTTSWKRFVLTTGTLTAATWYFQIGVDTRDTTQTVKPAATVFVWGADLQQGAFPTSYIPTTSVSVTRAADSATMPTAPWFTSANGTVVVTFSNNAWTAGTINNGLVAFDDGAGNGANCIVLYGYANSATFVQPNIVTRVASAVTSSFGTGNFSLSPGQASKAAGSWGGALVALSMNGSPQATSALTGLPSISKMYIGLGTAGVGFLNGWVRNISYWPRVLSAAEMQAVTT